MCAITFLKARTLSRISSARVTFCIQNCFYSELLKKKKFPECQTQKHYISKFSSITLKKNKLVDYFRSKKAKKMFRRKKNFDCKSPMKSPIYIFLQEHLL